jgi:hypothetical protein
MIARWLVTALTALAALSAPAAARQTCEGLAIARLIEPRSPAYAFTDGVDEPIRLTITRSADRGACNIFVNFVSEAGGGRDRALTGPGAGLRYELVDERGRVLENTSRGRDRLQARFDRDETELDLTVRLSIPEGQTVAAGAYSDRVAVRLFEQRGGGRLADELGVTFRARVDSRAEINLARQPGLGFDAGRSYDVVDFEELETGESRAIVLRVRANAAYRLTLTSENRGALVLQGGRGGDRIAYAARLDGRDVDLSAPALLMRDPLQPGASQELIFNVTIGEVGEARAGQYADLVTVYVEPVR